MQSHSLLATLWLELEGRNDTANILREILGQHTIELLRLDTSSQAHVQHALRPILWIKALFDIQRSYQQAAAYADVPGTLLPELVYAALLHILDARSRMFPEAHSGTDSAGQLLFVDHTMLSGFRLLTLLHEQLDRAKLLHLRQALLNASKNKYAQPENEQFILSQLLPAALSTPSSTELQSGNAYCLSLRQMGLPTFSEGLYPLCLRPGRLIELSFAHIREGSHTWLTWYWTLFDSIWASESALLQYHVDHAESSQGAITPVSLRAPPPVDLRAQLQNGRKNLVSAIYKSTYSVELIPQPCILDSLRATVVEWWIDDNARTASAPNSISEKQALEIRFALEAFRTWLRERNEAIAPVVSCTKCNPSPLRQIPMAIHGSERSNSIFFPKNPIRIGNDRVIGSERIDRLGTTSSSDGMSVTPTTSGSLSSSATGTARRPSSPSFQSRLTPMTSFNSQFSSSTGEETSQTPINPKFKRGKTLRHVLKSSKDRDKKQADSCKPSSFCFSSSGLHLFLWGGNLLGFIRVRAPVNAEKEINDGTKWELPAIKQIAAGNGRCVVLASHQDHFKLVSFLGDKPRPDSEITLDISLRHYTDCSMVMSRNDRFLALAVNDSVRLYRTDGGHMRRIHLYEQLHLYQHLAQERRLLQGSASRSLSSREAAREAQHQSSVVEQRLSFTPSGERLVVATHLADHYIYVDVYTTNTEPCTPISSHPKFFRLPPFTANDGGLTNVFFNDATQCAIVCALLAKDYPNLLYFAATLQDTVTDDCFGSKIVQAAQSSDSNFVVATGLTEIAHLVMNNDGTVDSRRLKKCVSKMPPNVFKPGNLALAAPEPQTAFAFWIKDSKLLLRRMDIGQSTESYADFDVRPLVDRLFSERLEPIILSSALSPTENALGEAVMLHSDSSLRPLVELPGSSRPITELAGSFKDTSG